MQELDESCNLIFMNEIGLDPGVDHMSAMKIIDEISDGKMLLFESFCGGLVAESDTNLWNYKFTWAPVMLDKALKAVQGRDL
jgi:saccharopine dehydrogenase-like NADP-dependent oxidoreductase